MARKRKKHHPKLLRYLILLGILLAIPLTVFFSQQKQNLAQNAATTIIAEKLSAEGAPESIIQAVNQQTSVQEVTPGPPKLGGDKTVEHPKVSITPPPQPLAASVDWSRYNPPVANQLPLESCVSWVTGYMLRGWYANAAGNYPGGTPPADPSSPFPDLNSFSGGFNPMYLYSQLAGGSPDNTTTYAANLNLLQSQGIDTRQDYSHSDVNYSATPTAAEISNATQFKIPEWQELNEEGSYGYSADTIKRALQKGPVGLMVDVYNNFWNFHPEDSGGSIGSNNSYIVPMPPRSDGCNGACIGRHAIFAYGYNDQGVFVQNTWGTGWGYGGRAVLSWDFILHDTPDAYIIVMNPHKHAVKGKHTSDEKIGASFFSAQAASGYMAGFAPVSDPNHILTTATLVDDQYDATGLDDGEYVAKLLYSNGTPVPNTTSPKFALDQTVDDIDGIDFNTASTASVSCTGSVSVICGTGDSTTNRLHVTWDIPQIYGPDTCNVYFYAGDTAYNVQGKSTPTNPCSGDATFSNYPGTSNPIDINGDYQLFLSNGDPSSCKNVALSPTPVSCPNNGPTEPPMTDYYWNHIIPGTTCVKNISDSKGHFLGGVAQIDCVPVVIKIIINAALVFMGTIAVIMIIYAGFKLVTSRGEAKQIESARKTITWAIIGLIVIMLSFFIINFIGTITGVDCIDQLGFHQCTPST